MTAPGERAWSVVAQNLPEHAGNPVHTDAGAQAAGFDRALVAGVTTYAYCCHPVIAAFGLDWVASGEGEVRFVSPVCDGDVLSFPVARRDDGGLEVTATIAGNERPRAKMSAWPGRRPNDEQRPGKTLEPVTVLLDEQYGPDYARRAGDDQTVCDSAGVVHPAVWPALANAVYRANLVNGPWVHTRSVARHHGLAPAGAEAEVSGVVVKRYHRNGERAVADVVIRVEGRIVATLEHEAIAD
ncbi:MAG TPA: hypothetical protein VGP46_02205 [Acidimicrobiales bacterium]|nr:hypothetical protein [Acidimicrobiales bacterium]